MDDVIHNHDYCRIPCMPAVGLANNHKLENTKESDRIAYISIE